MTVSGVTYATREQLKAAAGWDGATSDADADRIIESHTDKIWQLFHRRFAPIIQTRKYDFPSTWQVSPLILWLDADLVDLTTLTVGGSVIDAANYYLGPADAVQELLPYDRIELRWGSSATLSSSTVQRSIEVAGVYCYWLTEAAAGALTAGLDASVTVVPVTNAAFVGVGDLLHIDDEYMVVADRAYSDTGETTSDGLTASAAETTIPITSGSLVNPGETVLIDSERMFVEAATGSTLTVRRAFDGSTLATHTTGAAIYAARDLTVIRGAYGTTAATHADDTAFTRNVPPGLITDLVIAEAIAQRRQEMGGYGSTVGAGGDTTPDRIALLDLRKRAFEAYARTERAWL